MIQGVFHTPLQKDIQGWKESHASIDGTEMGLVENDGLWYRNGWIFITENQRENVMSQLHDSPLGGHPGINKMFMSIRRTFWWPTMLKDIRRYISGCNKCQRVKASRMTQIKILNPHQILEAPWQDVTVNLISKLPESNGFNAICIFVDCFSKQIHAIPTMTLITAQGMAALY